MKSDWVGVEWLLGGVVEMIGVVWVGSRVFGVKLYFRFVICKGFWEVLGCEGKRKELCRFLVLEIVCLMGL